MLTDLKRLTYHAKRDYQNLTNYPRRGMKGGKPITLYGDCTPMPSKPPKEKAGGTL